MSDRDHAQLQAALLLLERRQGRQHHACGRALALKYYAISVERRLTHPAALAISQAAKQALFVDAKLAKPLQAR
jgi:LysR family transcriptional activator of nhaA